MNTPDSPPTYSLPSAVCTAAVSGNGQSVKADSPAQANGGGRIPYHRPAITADVAIRDMAFTRNGYRFSGVSLSADGLAWFLLAIVVQKGALEMIVPSGWCSAELAAVDWESGRFRDGVEIKTLWMFAREHSREINKQ